MESKVRKSFEINIFNLGDKMHEFDFAIPESFFEDFEFAIIERGSGSCHLDLHKTETMMTLNFIINVSVELICDRSLKSFDYAIQTEEEAIIKFGDSDYMLSEDVTVLRNDAPSINVMDYIYEFISLAVPMKKLHPDLEGEDLPDLIYSSEIEDDSNEESGDPRWEALKKLKENK
ncbi:MAG: hypothetical protein ACJA0X_000453 [Cyclobacteriaceae bacterium]|jgi:uncharacterized protein